MNSTHQQAALDHVFRHEYGKIISILVHKFGPNNLEKVEDVVQDACIKTLKRKKTSEIKDLKNYISVAVRNLSLKKLQSAKKRKEFQEDKMQSAELSREDFLIQEENKERLQQAVNVLPNKSKRVFELCVLECIKYKNAAEVLDISINTVKFHLKKSFKILRLELQDAF